MAHSDDAGTPAATATAVADVFPTHNLGKPEVRERPPSSAAERLSPWI